MDIEAIRSKLPHALKQCLIEEPRPGGGTRLALDAPHRQKMHRKKAAEILATLDDAFDGVTIERVNLFGCLLRNAGVDLLLATDWFPKVQVLDLGLNGLTKKGVDNLAKGAPELRWLRFAHNKVGSALLKAPFPKLETLVLRYCGIDDKVLPKLGKAPLPSLRTLHIEGGPLYATPQDIQDAEESEPLDPMYEPPSYSEFAATPLGRQLTELRLSEQIVTRYHAEELAAFTDLTSLHLGGATVHADAIAPLGGLTSLKKLVVQLPWHTEDKQSPLRSLGTNLGSQLETLSLAASRLSSDDVAALFESSFPALTTLSLSSNPLGDAAIHTLMASDAPLTDLRLAGIGLTREGLATLLQSSRPFETLVLSNNDLGDDGAAMLGETELPSVRTLRLSTTHITDRGVPPLCTFDLTELALAHNRLSEDCVQALVDADWSLHHLDVTDNCLTDAAVARLRDAFPGTDLAVGKQDPDKLPPKLHLDMVFSAASQSSPTKHVVPPEVRQLYPHPAWVERDQTEPRWVYAMKKLPKEEEHGETHRGYILAAAVDADTHEQVLLDPPLVNPIIHVAASKDHRWLGIKAFRDGAYVVDMQTGALQRLGDGLTHQGGGVCFCGERLVLLECATEDDWQGRLDVYGHDGERWVLEHRLGGFYKLREEIVAVADHKMFAAKNRDGFFLCAIRGDQLRFLTWSKWNRGEVFDLDGTVAVKISKYTYALDNVDEVLDKAFAEGENPTSIPIPESAF